MQEDEIWMEYQGIKHAASASYCLDNLGHIASGSKAGELDLVHGSSENVLMEIKSPESCLIKSQNCTVVYHLFLMHGETTKNKCLQNRKWRVRVYGISIM